MFELSSDARPIVHILIKGFITCHSIRGHPPTFSLTTLVSLSIDGIGGDATETGISLLTSDLRLAFPLFRLPAIGSRVVVNTLQLIPRKRRHQCFRRAAWDSMPQAKRLPVVDSPACGDAVFSGRHLDECLPVRRNFGLEKGGLGGNDWGGSEDSGDEKQLFGKRGKLVALDRILGFTHAKAV